MHIIELKAQNIKNIKAVEIHPDDNAVILAGKNGAGKSAVLDCIFTALTGKKLDEPIRKGQERAEIVVNIGGLEVKKVFTLKGVRLEVKPLEPGETAQAKLDSLFSKISFDPSGFALMKPRDQRNLLAELVGLDFTDIEAEKQKVYEERKIINASANNVIAQNKNVPAPDPQTPDEEISYKEEIEKLNQIREKRESYARAIDTKNDRLEFLGEVEGEIESIKIQIENLKKELSKKEAEAAQLGKEIEEIVIPPEVTDAQVKEAEAALEEIEAKNTEIRAAKRYRKNIREGEKLLKESDALTQRLERLEQDKSTRTANAQFPIPGLSLSDDSVIYNGIPFSQISTGEQLRVSTSIAMALNPDARIILCREGSLLDEAGIKEVVQMAKDKDYQVWIERVSESGQTGIFIEDGEIKSIDGKEVESAGDPNGKN